jgi:hypothetical protein
MNMFTKAAELRGSQVPQADWASAEMLLDDLAETSWLLKMAQLGLGFNPDLLSLAERFNEPVGPRDPALSTYRPMAGTQAVR